MFIYIKIFYSTLSKPVTLSLILICIPVPTHPSPTLALSADGHTDPTMIIYEAFSDEKPSLWVSSSFTF
jgi:hypothetical protein